MNKLFMTNAYNTNYSLWLMPEGELQDSLVSLIRDVAQRYNAPTFPAHITLLGNVKGSEQKIHAKTQELTQSHTAFPITLTELDTTPEFYRALFIRAKQSVKLAHLYTQARRIFQFEPQREYKPHLSLLYADLSREQKQQITDMLQTRLQGLPHSFMARTVHLYSTEGPVETWQQIESFPLI
jgi:2'-5' RNA ligase